MHRQNSRVLPVNLMAYFKQKPHTLLPRHLRWKKVAELIGLSRDGRRRLDWVIYYETTSDYNASKTARHFGIARKTLYATLDRFESANLRTLEDQSTAPHHVRQRMITEVEERRIITLRKEHIHCGKEKLRTLYTTKYGDDISAHKILYTIQKYGLYPDRKKVEKTRSQREKYRKKRKIADLKVRNTHTLGWLMQLDTIVLHLGGLKRYILTAIDRYGKLAFARTYRNHSSLAAADFLRRLQFLLDNQIVNVQTDHGSEFAHHFEAACNELKISHYFSRVRTPKDNAVVERFNRTLQEEWLNDGNFHADTATMNTKLTDWLIYYNFTRPHASLGNLSPISYCVQTNRVLPMYSTGTTACFLLSELLVSAQSFKIVRR